LAAVSWGISEGLKLKDIKSAIEKFKNVPGRLEKVGRNIFVDYAHTPDALFNVISALRPLTPGRVIVVFGCGGERDRLKRPKMGKIVTALADYAIITSDNPRSENPLNIIKDICKGIQKDNYCVIADRLKAIKEVLKLIQNNDCLIIAGKGHEDYQVLKNKVLHFSDREVVAKCLR
jgi:UDP-N-acetylmuramoyl-L-alanyl-D-glutamate--2,6-diaminopimelate ligase